MDLQKKKIFLCGFYGCGNLGDDALLLALLRAFREYENDADVAYLTGGDTSLSYIVGGLHGKEIPRNPCSVLRAIRQCDALVFGGGSVLQNATGQASLYAYLSLLHLAQRHGKKTAILAGGIGPIDGEGAKRATAAVLRGLDHASFRDPEACEAARRFGVNAPRLSADPALLLRPSPCDIPLPSRFLLVSLRKMSGMPILSAAHLIFCIAEKKGLTPVLCDLFPKEDASYTASVAREISRLYASRGNKTAAWTLPHLSCEKLLAVTSRAELVLSGRYHLALFAYGASVPFFVLGDDPKLVAIAAEARAPHSAENYVKEDISVLMRTLL